MAQTIKLKRSAQSGASGIPSTSDLALGEVGINTYHGKMYIKKDDGTESIVEVGSTASFLPLSGGTLTGNLSLGDNVKAQFGNNDLQIYHDGSASYIKENGTGDLIIQGSNTMRLQGSSNQELANFSTGGAVTLFNNGSSRFATTSTGTLTTGTSVVSTSMMIGSTDSPSRDLEIKTTNPHIRLTDTDASGSYTEIFGGSGITTINADKGQNVSGSVLKLSVDATDGITINSNHNVSIPNGDLDVNGSVVADGLTVSGSITNTGNNYFADATSGYFFAGGGSFANGIYGYGTNNARIDTNSKIRINIASNGDISFYDSSGSSQNLFWDSSTSRLGLGVTNPANKLEISGGNIRIINQSTGRITFNNGSTEAYFGFNGAGSSTLDSGSQPLQIQAQGSNHIQFDTNSAERLKINADGSSVFSGAVSVGSVAQVFTSSDRGYFVAGTSDSSNQHLYLGSYHGSTLKELVFSGSNGALYPKTTASIDLGLTTHKFKNLNLSGTISSGAITATSNGNNQIHAKGTDTNSTAILMDYNGTGSTDRVRIYNHGGGFQFLTQNSSQKMLIAKTGAVNIINSLMVGSTTTPTGNFNSYISATRQITHNGNGGDLSVISDNNSNPVFYVKGTGNADLVNVFDNTTEVFKIADGGAATFSGSVGIGTGTVTAKITLADHTTAAGGIKFRSASNSVSLWSSGSGNLNSDATFNTTGRIRLVGGQAASDPDIHFTGAASGTGFSRAANDITFITAASEAARIDASQNLLVGKPSSSFSTTGTELLSDGAVTITRSGTAGGTPFFVNRLSNSGELIAMYQDSVQKGNISVSSLGMGFGGGTRSSDFFIKTDGTASFASGINVGIGTSSNLSSPLTIQTGGGGNSISIIGRNNGTLDESVISFYEFDGTTRNVYILKEAGNLTFATGTNGSSSESARLTSGGTLLVGTTGGATYQSTVNEGVEIAPDFIGVARNQNTVMHLNRQGNDGTIVDFRTYGFVRGSVSISGSTTSYNTSSDERLKENIKDSDDSGSKVDAIQVRQFDWKADGEHQDYGMVAQELLEVAPDAVTQGDTPDDMMGVDYSKLVPMLIKEIQSLRQRVAQLEE